MLHPHACQSSDSQGPDGRPGIPPVVRRVLQKHSLLLVGCLLSRSLPMYWIEHFERFPQLLVIAHAHLCVTTDVTSWHKRSDCHVWVNLRTISLTGHLQRGLSFQAWFFPHRFLCNTSERQWRTLRTLESFGFTVRSPVNTSVRWVPGVAKRWVYSASRSCEFHPVRLKFPFLPCQSPPRVSAAALKTIWF